MKVKSESEVAQLCPTPSKHMDCSLPGSSVHGIFQARVLEWGAIDFSYWNASWLINSGTLFLTRRGQEAGRSTIKVLVDLVPVEGSLEEGNGTPL